MIVVASRAPDGWRYVLLHRAHHGPEWDGDWAWTPPSGSRKPGEDVGTVVVAARLVKGHDSAVQLWLPVAALGVAVFVGYAFTRMLSTPLDNQDVGNWACMLGLAALFVEGLLVAVAAYAISLGRTASLQPLRVSSRTGQEQ